MHEPPGSIKATPTPTCRNSASQPCSRLSLQGTQAWFLSKVLKPQMRAVLLWDLEWRWAGEWRQAPCNSCFSMYLSR